MRWGGEGRGQSPGFELQVQSAATFPSLGLRFLTGQWSVDPMSKALSALLFQCLEDPALQMTADPTPWLQRA